MVLDREAAMERAEDAVADRILVTRRAAQRDDRFPEQVRRSVAEIEIRILGRLVLDLQQGQVGILVGRDDLRAIFRSR